MLESTTHDSVNMFAGMRVVSHPLATRLHVEHRVVKWPTKKKRKQWTVERIETHRPCAFVVDGVVYAHPAVIGAIKSQCEALIPIYRDRTRDV